MGVKSSGAGRTSARRGWIGAQLGVWIAVACVATAGCAERSGRGSAVPSTADGGIEPDSALPEVDASVTCTASEMPCASGCCPAEVGEEIVFDDERVQTSMIALDSSGTPHIVFTPYEGLQHGVRAEDGSWRIEPIPGAERARYASIAAGPDGSIQILYIVDYELWWSRWRDGSWMTESVDPRAAATGYALTVDASGMPRIAYQHQRFEGGFTADELHYAERSAAGTWRTELVHAESYDVGWMPSIAVDSAGTVAIVYCQDLCYTPPELAIKEAGGAWTHAPLPETIGRSQTTIFIDSLDHVNLAWMENGDGTVMYSYLSREGWVPLTLDPSFPNVGGRVQLMNGPDGELRAFYGRRHARLGATDTAWTVTPVELEHTEEVRDLMAATDASGALHLSYAWRDPETGGGELRYRRAGAPTSAE